MSNIKDWLPPILTRGIISFKKLLVGDKINPKLHIYKGNYQTWKDAKKQSKDYTHQSIIERIEKTAHQLKNKEILFERDGVALSSNEISWPLLSILLKTGIENELQVSVLDFGGSMGSSYFQNIPHLRKFRKVEWSVIEQEHYIKIAKSHFENSELKFYYTIEECFYEKKPHIILVSGVIQYIENYTELIHQILSKDVELIIFDRTPFINDYKHRITIEYLPDYLGGASYPCYFYNFAEFMIHFEKKYELLHTFKSYCDNDRQTDDGKNVSYGGFVLRKKQ